jgi:hypothetical protein
VICDVLPSCSPNPLLPRKESGLPVTGLISFRSDEGCGRETASYPAIIDWRRSVGVVVGGCGRSHAPAPGSPRKLVYYPTGLHTDRLLSGVKPSQRIGVGAGPLENLLLAVIVGTALKVGYSGAGCETPFRKTRPMRPLLLLFQGLSTAETFKVQCQDVDRSAHR